MKYSSTGFNEAKRKIRRCGALVCIFSCPLIFSLDAQTTTASNGLIQTFVSDVSGGAAALRIDARPAADNGPLANKNIFEVGSYTNTYLSVGANGGLAIGTTNTQGYKFAVNGDAILTKVKVRQFGSWPDYVFHPHFQLMPLNELEMYLQQNKHLPDVPSAKDVEDKGLDLGDTESILLKKIEELTLYVIDINKKLEKLSEENAALKKKLED